MTKNDLLINTNGYILNLLEKILDANVSVKGIENIPKDKPTMFVANHFTRTEAMLIPYSIYNITNKKVGVIADDSLFKTYFGNFLSNLGAMKKSDPSRNQHIISDLITGSKNWMIFPEGRMVKAKDIEKIENNFCVKIDGTCQRVHTGASYFALYSQILKEEFSKNKISDIKKFKHKYFINDVNDISSEETMIVPINISYSKLRNGKNFLINMAEKFLDDIGDNFKEEIEIEANIILNSKIVIQILEPISTKKILEQNKSKELNHNTIVNNIRYKITHSFMNEIYESLTINFDHIFMLVLFKYPKKNLDIKYFKRLLYLAIIKIKKRKLYFDEDITNDLINLISYEKHSQFEEVLQIAINDKLVEVNDDEIIINKDNILNSYTHNTIRLKNILRVTLNEILVNEKVVQIVKKLIRYTNEDINCKILKFLKNEEKKDYENAYSKYYHYKDLKPKEIAEVKYLKNEKSRIGMVLIHGFSSAPKEMEELALMFYNYGLNVYTPRLDGHGTVPEDLRTKSWKDWYYSVSRAITIASLEYEKIYIVGFSTGGLLSLLSANKKFKEFEGIICINAALNLNDIRIKTLLPALSFWNDLVKAFNEDEYAKEYLDNVAENPDINYNKHYIDSIEQLSLLMDATKDNLKEINCPIQIIQAKNDPVVNPSSAYEIYDKVKSKQKDIQILNASNHVIVKGDNSSKVFQTILEFINKQSSFV